MKKIVFFACSVIVAGGFMYLGLPGQPQENSYSGTPTFSRSQRGTSRQASGSQDQDSVLNSARLTAAE